MPVKTVLINLLAMNAGRILALILSAGILFVHIVNAEVYSWTDESGNMHFTDNPMVVPGKFKEKVQVREDGSDNRSWEYLASDSGADISYDTINVSYMSRNRYRVNIKESYAYAGREEYETQIILDCARQTYKPTQSTRIYKKQKSPVDVRGEGDQDNQSGMRDGSRRLSYPYQILSRILCKDSQR